MKKSNLLIIMISILLFTGFTGCLDNNGNNDTFKSGYNISYVIEINSEVGDNYTIKVPYPDNWNTIKEDIIISSGNPRTFTENTNYGNSLVIKGEGEVKISAKKEFGEKVEDLSMMENDGNTSIYIFCEKKPSNDISINLEFNVNPKNNDEFGYGYYLEKTLLDDGWQMIELENREV